MRSPWMSISWFARGWALVPSMSELARTTTTCPGAAVGGAAVESCARHRRATHKVRKLRHTVERIGDLIPGVPLVEAGMMPVGAVVIKNPRDRRHWLGGLLRSMHNGT